METGSPSKFRAIFSSAKYAYDVIFPKNMHDNSRKSESERADFSHVTPRMAPY